jgi:hypothetical protein
MPYHTPSASFDALHAQDRADISIGYIQRERWEQAIAASAAYKKKHSKQ